jgi:hypothetical protein
VPGRLPVEASSSVSAPGGWKAAKEMLTAAQQLPRNLEITSFEIFKIALEALRVLRTFHPHESPSPQRNPFFPLCLLFILERRTELEMSLICEEMISEQGVEDESGLRTLSLDWISPRIFYASKTKQTQLCSFSCFHGCLQHPHPWFSGNCVSAPERILEAVFWDHRAPQ